MSKYKYSGPGKKNIKPPLEITEEIAIWAARMCYGEGGKNCSYEKASAMLWALLNRWFMYPGRYRWKNFNQMMRLFSQPINKRWQAGGDLAKKYKGTKFASPARLKRRAMICKLEWDDIDYDTWAAVADFKAGTLVPPDAIKGLQRKKLSNWASLPSTPKKYPWGVKVAGDWFFQDLKLLKGSVVVDHWSQQ